MARHVVLDNVAHKNLKIITRRAAELGDNVAAAGVFPVEFRALQADYPIVFRKLAETGAYEPVSVFGFEPGENLFLRGAGWDASYLPMSVERQPFLIGLEEEGPDADERMSVHIDLDSKRVSEREGEPIFLEFGGVTPYLDHIRSVLRAIHEGHAANRAFSGLLVEYDLLEPFALDVELKNGVRRRMEGFHTISEETLGALDGDALEALHRRGFLEAAYMALASLSNFRKLIRWKQQGEKRSGL